jgi:hypothetical protein
MIIAYYFVVLFCSCFGFIATLVAAVNNQSIFFIFFCAIYLCAVVALSIVLNKEMMGHES